MFEIVMADDAADRLLARYIAATTDPEADALLGRILDETARPVVVRVVTSALRGTAHADIEDTVADTLAQLLRRLREVKSDPSRAIHDLHGYIATCAFNACHARLRERYPARNRLRNHLHYLFGHHPQLALWRTSDSSLVCGYRTWIGRNAVSAARAESIRIGAHSDPQAEDHAQIATLIAAVFRETGGPLELDVLVDTIGGLIHLAKRELPLTGLELVAPAADSQFELQLTLRELWDDIRELSPRQRTALLLGLRDAHGREILSLLSHTRTATMEEIAAAVEKPIAELAALWHELPLSDAAIARLLGATAAQVVKLRRLARERLRRMTERRRRPEARRSNAR